MRIHHSALIGFLIVSPLAAQSPHLRDQAAVREATRSALSSMRTMATALESYFIDNNSYPTMIAGDQQGALDCGDPDMAQVTTFRVWTGPNEHFYTLTTPQAYLTTYIVDPYTPPDDVGTFAYYHDRLGWIVWCRGPDGDFDITRENVGELYSSDRPQPSPELLTSGATYDPTNGIWSSGDVFRVRQ